MHMTILLNKRSVEPMSSTAPSKLFCSRPILKFWLVVMMLVFGLSHGDLIAQDLIEPSAEAASYRLSGAKIDIDRFGRPVFVVKYNRTKVGTEHSAVLVEGNTSSGKLRVFGAPITDASGELRLSATATSGDIEVYFVIQTSYGKMLVSNVARVGNPGTATRARSWTADETKAYERSKLAKTPPKNLPADYVAVEPGAKLLPGMPIKAGSYADWVDATVIRPESNGQVLVKIGQAKQLTLRDREKWLAIKPETLDKGKSKPEQFTTDIQVLPGSKLIIPAGAQPLPSDLALPVGTPLLYDYSIKWRDVYVVKSENGKITLRYKGFRATWDTTQPRSKFLIHAQTLKQLDQPDAADKFAANIELEEFPARASGRSSIPGRKLRHKDYPIDIPLPKDSQLVAEDLPLKEGVALAGCWANKWFALTVLHENGDGSIHVRWDRHGAGFDCNMKRSQLVIQNETAKELELNQASKQEAVIDSIENLAKTLRVWTDSTGAYKIEAYYIAHTKTKITLKTAAGREFDMPFSKLSDADQKLITKVNQGRKNPFE